jgi:hypothetical protein
MGAPKVGKTTATVVSLAERFGNGYVLECGDKSGLAPAMRRTKKFHFDLIRDENEMETAIKEARKGVKEGRYKWIVMDDYSLFGTWLEGALRDASAAQNKSGEADGRRYWPQYKTTILNIVGRLLSCDAHVVFVSHFIEQSPEIDGQRAKSGRGILPMFGGSVREELPARFVDVIFMDKEKDKRVFKVNPEGVWGPGCRSVDGTQDIPADFGEFWKVMDPKKNTEQRKTEEKKTTTSTTTRK